MVKLGFQLLLDCSDESVCEVGRDEDNYFPSSRNKTRADLPVVACWLIKHSQEICFRRACGVFKRSIIKGADQRLNLLLVSEGKKQMTRSFSSLGNCVQKVSKRC
mgnify:CR=1 FL=1